jgi:hypothetical protein
VDGTVLGSSSRLLVEFLQERYERYAHMFSFQAQLTFGLQTGREVNVAILFSRFLANAIKTVPDFSLYPYDDDKGQQVTATSQLPDDNSEFYATYYKNHRILQHSNLTGMISFRCSLSWMELKKPTSSFFQWLYHSKVFLKSNQDKGNYPGGLWLSLWCTPWIPLQR